MSLAVTDLQYLPSISWFKSYLKYPDILVDRHENFVKSSPRNRTNIATAAGKLLLSIPLQGGRDHHQKYTEVKIANTTNWQDKHWHSIKAAYGSAPFFEFYCDKFQKFYELPAVGLFDFNLQLLKAVLSALKIGSEVKFTDTYLAGTDIVDLRSTRSSNPDLAVTRYYQVFEEQNGFIPDLSIIDLLFNEGPQATRYLRSNLK